MLNRSLNAQQVGYRLSWVAMLSRIASLIYALGIRHVGETTGRTLAKNYGLMETFLQAMKAARDEDSEAYHELENIDGIGGTVAKALVSFFAESHNTSV